MSVRSDAERADRVTRDFERQANANAKVLFRNAARISATMNDLNLAHVDDPAAREAKILPLFSAAELSMMTKVASLSMSPEADATLVNLWSKFRVAYTFDPDTAAALIETFRSGDNTVIPGEVLARIPHPNPFLLFPTPVTQVNSEGRTERYLGVYLRGVRTTDTGQFACLTSDEDATDIELCFMGHVIDSDGNPVTMALPAMHSGQVMTNTDVVRIAALTPLQDMTVPQRVDHALSVMLADRPVETHRWSDEAAARESVSDLLTIGLSLLVYCVTDNADRGSKVDKKQMRGKKRRGTADPAAEVYPLGYRIGHALRAAAAPSTNDTPTASTGRTVRPHLRASHLHRFWKGPRDGSAPRYQVVHWLPPIPVNTADGKKKPSQTVVHRINH